MVVLFWRRQKSRFSVLDSITQHVAGKDFAVFLPEHVLRDSGSSTDWACLVLARAATTLKLR